MEGCRHIIVTCPIFEQVAQNVQRFSPSAGLRTGWWRDRGNEVLEAFASKEPWTKEIWFFDYRTNVHHTLKKKPLRFEDLQEFIADYNPMNRHERRESWNEATNPEGRWRKYSYEQIVVRDKTSLDIFWLKDKSLADLDNLPEPDILALEIIENLEAGLNSFREIAAAL